MSTAEPTSETGGLSEGVLGMIGAYEMGAALDARDLYTKVSSGSRPPKPVLASPDTYTSHSGDELAQAG